MSESALRQENETLRNKMTRWAKAGAEQFGHIKATAEVGAAALGVGFVLGRYADENGEYKIVGVDLALGVTFVTHGIAYSGFAGKYAEDLHNLGNGSFAIWAGGKGVELGRESLESSGVAGVGRMAAARRGQGHGQVGARHASPLHDRIARMRAAA